MNFRTKETDNIDVNITPLIDVVFLLLIFFMVSTTFEHDSEINLTLPKASKEMSQPREEIIKIAIDNESNVYINDNRLIDSQISTIKEVIYQQVADVEDASIIISADEKTPYFMVIRTMDAARQLGVLNITFATRISEQDY